MTDTLRQGKRYKHQANKNEIWLFWFAIAWFTTLILILTLY